MYAQGSRDALAKWELGKFVKPSAVLGRNGKAA